MFDPLGPSPRSRWTRGSSAAHSMLDMESSKLRKPTLLSFILGLEAELNQQVSDSSELSRSRIFRLINETLHSTNLSICLEHLEHFNLSKDDEKSTQLRLEGNIALEKKEYKRSLMTYNCALIEANTVLSRSRALANRAVVLRRLQYFRLAIQDTESALSLGHPDRLKLYMRVVSILTTDLHAFDEAHVFVSNLVSTVSEMELTKLRQIISVARNAMGVSKDSNLAKATKMNSSHGRCFINDSVQVSFDPAMQNRFLVAKERLEVGTAIISNESNVCYVDLNNPISNCYACLQSTLLTFIPCLQCKNVVFCSLQCFQNFQQRHEKFDCKLLSHVLSLLRRGMKEHESRMLQLLLLALRALNDINISTMVNNRKRELKKLISTEHLMKAETSEVLRELTLHLEDANTLFRAAAAVVVAKVCFDQEEDLDKRACAFFHIFSASVFNNHVIQEISQVGRMVSRRPSGVAVFPVVASIVNHSCDPNTITVVQGLTQTTIATRTIEKDEPVTHVYQCHFGDTILADRQHRLSTSFHFECACDACKLDYPISSKLVSDPMQATCSYLHLNKTIEEVMTDDTLGVIQRTEKALRLYEKRQRLLCYHLKRPHLLLLTGRAAIQDHYWLLLGNKAQHLKLNQCALNALYP